MASPKALALLSKQGKSHHLKNFIWNLILDGNQATFDQMCLQCMAISGDWRGCPAAFFRIDPRQAAPEFAKPDTNRYDEDARNRSDQ